MMRVRSQTRGMGTPVDSSPVAPQQQPIMVQQQPQMAGDGNSSGLYQKLVARLSNGGQGSQMPAQPQGFTTQGLVSPVMQDEANAPLPARGNYARKRKGW